MTRQLSKRALTNKCQEASEYLYNLLRVLYNSNDINIINLTDKERNTIIQAIYSIDNIKELMQ